MASSVVPLLLFLGLVVAFPNVHARDSNFFSKFTANPDATSEPEMVGPSEKQADSLEKQPQDMPSFVAQDKNGYGLYGHETGLFPPSETDTAPAVTTTSFSDEPYFNKDVFATEDEVDSDTKALLQGSSFDTAATTEDSYDRAAVKGQRTSYFPTEEQGFPDTDSRLQGSRYTTPAATGVTYGNVVANGQDNYYAVGNRYTANNGNNAQQQQGMSDTRFHENGKYYYDVNDDEKYNPTLYADTRNEEFGTQRGYVQGGKDGNTYEFGNNYYAGNYGAEETNRVTGGGYEPVKELEAFRATRNVDSEFTP